MSKAPQITFEDYLRRVDLPKLLRELGATRIRTFLEVVKHFTEKEIERRDSIVLGYFGKDGIERITNSIVSSLLMPPKLKETAKILDVGAGSGFFTLRVINKLRRGLPQAAFYAMDLTPAMLRDLSRKTSEVTLFLGVGENIIGSVEHARKILNIPEKFDGIFSTLMLHHCSRVEEVFESFRKVVDYYGKAVVVDLCRHSFEEFREEMGDLHLGFDIEFLKNIGEIFFLRLR